VDGSFGSIVGAYLVGPLEVVGKTIENLVEITANAVNGLGR
jgi:hypothetical protein